MTLELAAIPLALVAGVAGVLSPCVWPLVPVVTSSAAVSGRSGPYWLAGGLSVSFAVAGTVLTLLLVSTGLDPELFRYFSAALLVAIGLLILVPALNRKATHALSSLTALGWSLLLLGVLVMTGLDKTLEALAVTFVPGWVYSF